MNIKELIGKRVSKEVPFMGNRVSITKLNVAEVRKIQARAAGLKDDDSESFAVLRDVLRMSVADAADLTDEDFDSMPMDELSNLSKAIMEFSGLGEKQGK